MPIIGEIDPKKIAMARYPISITPSENIRLFSDSLVTSSSATSIMQKEFIIPFSGILRVTIEYRCTVDMSEGAGSNPSIRLNNSVREAFPINHTISWWTDSLLVKVSAGDKLQIYNGVTTTSGSPSSEIRNVKIKYDFSEDIFYGYAVL